MNQLSRYLDSAGVTQAEFAGKLGVSQATVSKFCRGLLTPSLEIAVKLERMTGGQVTATSWIPDPATSLDESAA